MGPYYDHTPLHLLLSLLIVTIACRVHHSELSRKRLDLLAPETKYLTLSRSNHGRDNPRISENIYKNRGVQALTPNSPRPWQKSIKTVITLFHMQGQ